MGIISEINKQTAKNIDHHVEGTCYNCNRSKRMGVKISSCVFAVNPNEYSDFYTNNSICTFCLNEICNIFQHDFYVPNEDLLDNYYYVRDGGFFQTTRDRADHEIVFVLGIRANMPEDYHVLIVDSKYQAAVDNVVKCLKKGAVERMIKGFRDLL